MALLRILLPLLLLAPYALAHEALEMFNLLVGGINIANRRAAACTGRANCFATPFTITLPAAAKIFKPLPALQNGAVLNIKGGCGNSKLESCVIDAQNQFSVFSSAPAGGVDTGYSKLRLSNLIFQNAKGGVFVRMNTEISARSVVFQNNVGGVELGGTNAAEGNPARYFLNCQFLSNTGGAITADNGLYGLARDSVGYYVKGSVFLGNKGAGPGSNGGAVMVSGAGVSTFEDVIFQNNVAYGAGGAVYAESTSVVFRRTSFLNNVALKGAAGAVSGATSDDGDFAASFCSCTFAGNRAPADARAASLSFYVANPGYDNMNLKFCNSTAAIGSRLPKNTVASIQVYSTQNSAVCLASC